MIESTQGIVPPFAPAAPIGSDKIAVYAQQDVYKEVEGKDGNLKKVLVHEAGHRQELEASIAREVVRNSPKDYGFIPPGGAVQQAATGSLEPGAATSMDRVAAILEDPEALRLLREAILVTPPIPPVGLVTDLGAPGGLAAVSDANGGHQADGSADAFQLTNLPGVNDKLARSLEDNGFGTLAALQGATVETLSAVPGMGEKLAKNVVAHVAEKYPTKKEG